MAVVRRFLILSAFARMIRRDRGVNARIVEGHFPPRSDRRQFVRVERDQAFLVLRAKGQDGEVITEQSQVPLSQAEALIDVAPGRVAFDRTDIPLGYGAEGWLERLIVPSGLDLLTVNLTSDPRMFAPALWFGPEVTNDAQFDTGQLALNGIPNTVPGEVSNDALEALLDWIEGKSVYSFQTWFRPVVNSSVAAAPHAEEVSSPQVPDGTTVILEEVLPLAAKAIDMEQVTIELLPEGQAPDPAPTEPHQLTAAPSPSPEAADARLAGPRRPTLRDHQPELEDGIARLARSLAPKRFRSGSASEPLN
jgi:CYTH domain-containing protein